MKGTVIALSLVVICATCQAKDRHVEDLWNYVSQNEARIYDATNADKELWDTLNQKVQQITDGLAVRANAVEKGQKRDLIITAAGNRSKFPWCFSIVADAPKFKLIKPVALMPPAKVYPPYIYLLGNQRIELKFEDVKVHFDDAKHPPIGLVLILPSSHYGIISANKKVDLMNFYYNLLIDMTMQVLGEQVMADKIGSIDLLPISAVMPYTTMDKLAEYIH